MARKGNEDVDDAAEDARKNICSVYSLYIVIISCDIKTYFQFMPN